jgi:ABC-type microcin C transport system duplicated ATPase subunit YejF
LQGVACKSNTPVFLSMGVYNAPMSFLEVTHLTARFGNNSACLQDINFSMMTAETLAVVGESGSGKTVLGLSILNLLAGRINLLQASQKDLVTLRGGAIGFVFQEPMTALNPLHRVGRQLEEALRLHQPTISKKARTDKVYNALEGMGLNAHLAHRYPHQLSGGQRQRVLLALALINDPALLIADEPTTALDAQVRGQIVSLIKKEQQRRGLSVLLISHDLALVRNWADRAVVLHKGAVVETGTVRQLIATPKQPYTQSLFTQHYPQTQVAACMGRDILLTMEDFQVSLRGQGFWRRRNVPIVHGVSVRLETGQTLGIIGESGSGKTTLARALLRLLPAKGRVCFDGQDWLALEGSALRRARRGMQIVFQDPFGSLNPRLLVGNCVAEGLRVHEPNADPVSRTTQLLASVGLEAAFAQRYPHELSGGQRQRVALARAMAVGAKLIVLDEPTSALDAHVAVQIVALLQHLQQTKGLSYIIVSHDLAVIKALSQQVVVLKEGKVVEQGATAGVFSAPKNSYTQALMAAGYL